MTSTTCDHLELFRTLFPLSNVVVNEEDMRYRLSRTTVRHFYKMAQKIIAANHLRVVANLDIWSMGGYIRKIDLRIEYAPEMYLIER